MSDHHPLRRLWPLLRAQFIEGPQTTALPREEIIRICKTMYFLGVSDAMLGMAAFEILTDGHPEQGDVRCDYFEDAGKVISENREMTVDQILATMRAHEVK